MSVTIRRAPAYMYVTGGSFVELGSYTRLETSSSVHKTSQRPKPKPVSTAPTPLYGDELRITYGDSSYDVGPGQAIITGPCSLWDTLPYGYAPSKPSFMRLHVDLKLKVKDEVINLAQNLAEYKQTCSMFSGLASDIYRTFRSLRRGRIPKGPDSWSKEAANRWLEYQYGLKPLMSDLYDSFNEMSRVIPKPVFHRYKANAKTSDSSIEHNPHGSVLMRSQSSTWSLRSRVTAVVSRSSIRTAAEYGLTNPLLLAWELIPYSFVIDWMIPVGDVLSSLDALVGVDTVLCENGARLDWEQSMVTLGGGVASLKYKSVERDQGFSLDYGSAFSYSPSSSLTAVLNGLALLRQFR